jgi:hypothetical protein
MAFRRARGDPRRVRVDPTVCVHPPFASGTRAEAGKGGNRRISRGGGGASSLPCRSSTGTTSSCTTCSALAGKRSTWRLWSTGTRISAPPATSPGAAGAASATRERRAGSFCATSAVRASASPSVRRPTSRAAISATTTLPRSIVRLKIALGCSCAVTALPLGPDGGFKVNRPDRPSGGVELSPPGRMLPGVLSQDPVLHLPELVEAVAGQGAALPAARGGFRRSASVRSLKSSQRSRATCTSASRASVSVRSTQTILGADPRRARLKQATGVRRGDGLLRQQQS